MKKSNRKEARKWLLQSLDQAKQFCCPIGLLSDLTSVSRFDYIEFPCRLNVLDSESTDDFYSDYDLEGEESEDSDSEVDEESTKSKSIDRVYLPYEKLRNEFQKWFENTPEREILYDKRRLLMFLIRQSKRKYPASISPTEKLKSPTEVLNLLMMQKNPREIHQILMTFFLPDEIKNIRSFKGLPLKDFQVFLSRPMMRRIVERKRKIIQFCLTYHQNFEQWYGLDDLVRGCFMKVFSLPRLSKIRLEKRIMFYRNCALVLGPTLPSPYGKNKKVDPAYSKHTPLEIHRWCFEELGNLFVWCKHYRKAMSFFDFLYFEREFKKFEYIHHLFESYQGIIHPLEATHPIDLKGDVDDFDISSVFETIGLGEKYGLLIKEEKEEEEKEGEEDDDKKKKKTGRKGKREDIVKSLISRRMSGLYEKWKYQIDIEENNTTIRHVKVLLTTYISVESLDFVAVLDKQLDQKFVYLLYRLNDDSSLIYRLLANYEAVEIFVELRRELERVKNVDSSTKSEMKEMKKKMDWHKKQVLNAKREQLRERRMREKYEEESRILSEKYEFTRNSYLCCMQIIRGENHLLKYIKRKDEFVTKDEIEKLDSWESRWRRSVLGVGKKLRRRKKILQGKKTDLEEEEEDGSDDDEEVVQQQNESRRGEEDEDDEGEYDDEKKKNVSFASSRRRSSKSSSRSTVSKKMEEDRNKLKLQLSNDTEATMFQLEGAVNPYISIIIKALNIYRVEMYNIGSDRLCQNILKVTPHITELDLFSCDATDKVFDFAPNLEILEIDRCDGIDGSGLSKLLNLRELKIQNNNSIFNDAFLGMEHLTQLSIKWMNKITIDGLKHLKGLRFLCIGLGIRIEEEDLDDDILSKRCKIQFFKEYQ